MLAAIAPCMGLYAWLGAALDASAAAPYAQWVQTYADPNIEISATRLERLLDEQAKAQSATTFHAEPAQNRPHHKYSQIT